MKLETESYNIGPYMPNWTDVYLLLTGIMAFFHNRRLGKITVNIPKAFWGYILASLAACIVTRSELPYPVDLFWLALGVFFFRLSACMVIACLIFPTLSGVRDLTRTIVFVIISEALFGVYHFWSYRNDPTSFMRIQASGMPPTIMGMFLLMGLGCALWWMNTDIKIPIILRISITSIIFGSLVMTLSRGPIIGGIFILCWLMTVRMRQGRRLLMGISLALITFVIIYNLPILGADLSSRLEFGTEGHIEAIMVRSKLAYEAFDLIKSSPLVGIGFMGFPLLTQIEHTGTITCHNLFLQTWMEFGLISLVMLLLVIAPFVRDAFSFGSRTKAANAYIGATLCGFLFSQLVDYGFLYHKTLILFWLLTGLFFQYRILARKGLI
jgi:hypothetical protein